MPPKTESVPGAEAKDPELLSKEEAEIAGGDKIPGMNNNNGNNIPDMTEEEAEIAGGDKIPDIGNNNNNNGDKIPDMTEEEAENAGGDKIPDMNNNAPSANNGGNGPDFHIGGSESSKTTAKPELPVVPEPTAKPETTAHPPETVAVPETPEE